jgi:hypothetical protein
MARKESLGFFDDISVREWKMLRQKVKDVYPNTFGRKHPTELRKKQIFAKDFFQQYFEPDFTCRHERRIGALGDGGKWVCDPHRLQNKSCLVYSIGSNGDTSFEQAILDEIGHHCEIHTFDPGNFGAVVNRTGAVYHEWGLAKETRTTTPNITATLPPLMQNVKSLSPRQQQIHQRQQKMYRLQQQRRQPQHFKSLKDTVKALGHQGRTIDIFKIDCEGCEWDTYQSWLEEDSGVDMRQILVEIHSTDPSKRFANQRMMPPETMDFFDALYRHNYVIVAKEVNIMHWSNSGQCAEFAFLKMAPEFFSDIPEFNGTGVSK